MGSGCGTPSDSAMAFSERATELRLDCDCLFLLAMRLGLGSMGHGSWVMGQWADAVKYWRTSSERAMSNEMRYGLNDCLKKNSRVLFIPLLRRFRRKPMATEELAEIELWSVDILWMNDPPRRCRRRAVLSFRPWRAGGVSRPAFSFHGYNFSRLVFESGFADRSSGRANVDQCCRRLLELASPPGCSGL